MSHTTSDARKRAAETVQTIDGDRVETWGRPEARAVPRVARSVDDLRVGQVVAWKSTMSPAQHGWCIGSISVPEEWDFSGIVILADPPEPDFLVPRAVIERLREAARYCDEFGPEGTFIDAARALLDAATEVEDR